MKATKEIVDSIEEPSKKRTKQSRHWKENETRISVSKWSEENIQEQLKPIRKEVSVFLRASGYDRDDESCKVRIHILLLIGTLMILSVGVLEQLHKRNRHDMRKPILS